MARFRDLTEDQIDTAEKGQLVTWLEQAMQRLYKFFSQEEYYKHCHCWACRGRKTAKDVRAFLKWAVRQVDEYELSTKLVIVT